MAMVQTVEMFYIMAIRRAVLHAIINRSFHTQEICDRDTRYTICHNRKQRKQFALVIIANKDNILYNYSQHCIDCYYFFSAYNFCTVD